MRKAADGLWITDAQAAEELPEDHEFDEVVSVGKLWESATVKRVPTTSTADFVFPDGTHDYGTFAAAVDYVRKKWNAGKRVLVHCQAGVSRSTGVATAAIAAETGEEITKVLKDTGAGYAPVAPEIMQSVEEYVDNGDTPL